MAENKGDDGEVQRAWDYILSDDLHPQNLSDKVDELSDKVDSIFKIFGGLFDSMRGNDDKDS